MHQVRRDQTAVIFVRASDRQQDISAAWKRLEMGIPLQGRRFYGAFFPEAGEYWAAAELIAGDDPEVLGLEIGILPGGRFLWARLRGRPPGVYDQVAPIFEAMRHRFGTDSGRPSLESYRSAGEIDLLHPLASALSDY